MTRYVYGADGYRWRVVCESGGVLGLEPTGWRRIYWAVRLRSWRPMWPR